MRKVVPFLLISQAFLIYLRFFYQPPYEVLPYSDLQPLQQFQDDRLEKSEILLAQAITQPQDLQFGPGGQIFIPTSDGKVLQLKDGVLTQLLNTNGHPLGLKYHRQSNSLFICDCWQGLLKFDFKSKQLKVLVAGQKSYNGSGILLNFADNLAIKGNKVYFTEASTKFDQKRYIYDILQAGHNGKLFSYDLIAQQVEQLAADLYFPNGLDFIDQENLIIAETTKFRLLKFNIRTKEIKVFSKNMPGYPDNLWVYPATGDLYVGLTAKRTLLLDTLFKYQSLRRYVIGLPKFILDKFKDLHGYIVRLDKQGNLIQTFQSPSGRVHTTTGAKLIGSRMYVSSLEMRGLAVLDLKNQGAGKQQQL